MNATNKRFLIFIVGTACLGLVACGATDAYGHGRVNSIDSEAKVYRDADMKQRTDNKKLNIGQLRKQYDEANLNLNPAMDKTRSNVSKGMELAFSDCHHTKDYNKNQAKIKKDLGSLASPVLSLVKPSANQAFPKPTSFADKMVSCNVGFGANTEGQIPVDITVVYQTPAYNTLAGAGGYADKAKPTKHTRHFTADAILEVKSGKLSVQNTFNDNDNNNNDGGDETE